MQGQEEALGLSGQLSDARQQVATLAAALEQARTHLEAQQTALAQVRGAAACMLWVGEQRPQLGGREHSSRLVAQIGLLCFSEALKLYCAVCPPISALQQQTERTELVQRAEAAEAAAEKQRAAAGELRRVLDALR